MVEAAQERSEIRVLVIEDSLDDADLLIRELRRAGYMPSYRFVASASHLIESLEEQEWDVILCDYTMPGFSGIQALSLVRSHTLDVPFIYVSGTIGEEMAVAAMKSGAQDYVVKHDLRRLVPAIERELRENERRRKLAETESERRLYEARFREVLAMAPDAIVATTEDFRITIFNRAAEELFGYAAEAVMGQPLDLLLPERYAERHRDLIRSFARGPDGARRMNEKGSVYGRRANGEEFAAEASISKAFENEGTTFMVAIRDVSEQKRNEELLRKLSSAVDQSASLVLITGIDGTIEYANPSLLKASGYQIDEVIGQSPSLFKSDGLAATDFSELWRTVLSGRNWQGELENQRKDGTALIVSMTISPIKNNEGEVTHFIGIQEDITERRHLQEQLRQSRKLEAVGQLTGGIAHDFNNLLGIVVGNLELMRMTLGAWQHEAGARPPELDSLLQAVDHSIGATQRGAALTQQLLAFARRQPLSPEPVDVGALIGGLENMLSRTLGETIVVETVAAETLWACNVDRSQLENAVLNLAINARDAMPRGGKLLIEASNAQLDEAYAALEDEVQAGDYVLVAVSDTGEGIPEEHLRQIFEPFFTTKEVGKGSGLGLSMVYGFIKQSGGHLKVYSERGHGTTLKLYLPRDPGTASDAAQPAGRTDDEMPLGKGERILVVEDDPELSKLVEVLLETLNYRSVVAPSGPAALAILDSDLAFDALLTDVILPEGLGGRELAGRVAERIGQIKLLYMSGYTKNSIVHHGRLDAGVRLLQKPFRRADLARALRAALDDTDDGD